MRRQEGIGLGQESALETDPTSSRLRRPAIGVGQRTSIEVPQPVLQLGGLGAADLEVDAAKSGGDGRLPDARVGQVGEDAQVRHGLYHFSPNGRISTLNDQALGS